MPVNRWYSTTGVVVVAIAASWASPYFETPQPVALGVVTTRPLAANHKITADDLAFSLLRRSLPEGAIDSPDGAVGACTNAALNRDEPVVWQRLTPPGNGDDSCANAALAVSLVDSIAKILVNGSTAARNAAGTPPAGAPPGSTPPAGAPRAPSPPTVTGAPQTPEWAQLLQHPPAELDAATRSAIGEFRGEFVKEFGKHLADNAADRIFGCDTRPEDVKPNLVKQDIPQPPKSERLRLGHVSYFAMGRSAIDPKEHDALVGFATEVRRHADCRVTIDAFADRTGGQVLNLWLSWLRGNAVAAVFVERGIERQHIAVAAHGDDASSVGAPADEPAALNRRAETVVVCATSGGDNNRQAQ